VPGRLCTGVGGRESVPVEVRLYDRLFKVERPDLEEAPFETLLNPHSLEILADSRIEPVAVNPELGESLQFRTAGLLFSAIPSLRSPIISSSTASCRCATRGAMEDQKQSPAVPASLPMVPRGSEGGRGEGPEQLSAEEMELLEQLRPELLSTD